ncbi:MAG: glycosyl hydrolase [Sulfolobales archaeon]
MLSRDLFKNPPNEFRGVPFYSVNDLLSREEIAKHIKYLKEAGFGGVFFHAREGLITPFLSEEWFDSFEEVVKEASRHGMTVWIYDEDRWPSGFASGIIPAESRDYRPKSLLMIIDNKTFFGEDTLAVFKCETDENSIPTKCTRIHQPESSSRYLYLSFLRNTASLGETWFSGLSYVDLLNPKAVKRFIEVAYEPYVKRFSKYIGSVIPGVFTDEPNIHDSRPRFPSWMKKIPVPPRGPRLPHYSIPWSDNFTDFFKKINGYDIVDHLPKLFFDIDDYVKIRYDYWRTITLLFIESFTKQIYEWCDAHNLKFTGHFLLEDDLIVQLVVGSVMPHYEYMHVPGIDHLGLQIWGSLLTAKQVASVANQLGRERVLSETYGCLGLYGTFEDRKWIGDFLYALGINLLNHHLVPYSLRGRRKSDYGLMFHWSQPWWKYNRYIEDYFARLSYVLSRGQRIVDVLVISPMSSVWSTYTPVNESKAREINDLYIKLLRELLSIHVDFELGDELIIEKYGRVENGLFKIGRGSYKIVIVPYSHNLSSKTLDLLQRFVSEGGEVVFLRQIPKYIDGVEKRLPDEFLKRVKILRDLNELRELFEKKELLVKVDSDDKSGEILYHVRKVDDKYIVFVANVSRESSYKVRIGLLGSFTVEKWDPFTGEIETYTSRYSGNRTYVDLTLDPVRSELLVFSPGMAQTTLLDKNSSEHMFTIDLGGEWFIERSGPNILVIDKARIYLDKESRFSEPMYLPKMRDDYMINRIGDKFLLRYEFEIKKIPEKDLELVIEYTGSIKKIYVNNYEIDPLKPLGSWIDPSFKRYKLPREVLREGVNHVDIEVVSSLEPEIEPIYVLGEFGVELVDNGRKPVIVSEKRSLEIRGGIDLVKEGYPFYSGEIILSTKFVIDKKFTKAILEIGELNAVLAEIEINDVKFPPLIYRKNSRIDISKALREGENNIKIRLVGSLRNTLGPLHREDPIWTGPETFYIIDATWRDEYVLRPFGFKQLRIDIFE